MLLLDRTRQHDDPGRNARRDREAALRRADPCQRPQRRAQAADLDARLAGLPAAELLAALIGDRLAGRIALVSSFGA